MGIHCIAQLLRAGHPVRTTVRTAAREADVRAALKHVITDASPPLSFVVADLSADAGWQAAAADCSFVFHVASPFPVKQPRDENELIVPAREGALRVLRAARDAKVKRVVMTSSFAAIGYGQTPTEVPFTEEQWTVVDGRGVSPYIKSKAIAERAAWDFIEREGRGLELTVINPVGIFGPALSSDLSTSIRIIEMLLLGQLPATPRISFGVVDVRDVAELHLRAMKDPAAAGERFLAVAGPYMSMQSIARLLRERLGEDAKRVPTRQLPDWLVWVTSFVSRDAALVLPELGVVRTSVSDKARRMLGWQPRSNEEAILATAHSLLQLQKGEAVVV